LVHALQEDGWYWRNDGIWSKAGGNCPRCYYRIEKGSTKPESVKDRFVRAHEYVFVLAKSSKYFFDHIVVRESHSPAARRDVFHLPNQNFRSAHYATMPESLAELCVRGGSPDGGCCHKCRTPFKRITKKKALSRAQKIKWGGSGSDGNYDGKALKDYAAHTAEDPSALKKRILQNVRFVETIGWEPSCKCKDPEPVPSLVLDPFSGAATTGAVAIRHGRAYIGLELLGSNNTDIAGPRLDAEVEARKRPDEIEFLPTEESGVYHGAAEIMLHRVPPESVRLILTDPPYNVSRENNFHTMGREGINFEWDGGFDQETWIRLADKALMPGGSIVIWNDWKVLGLIAHLLLDLGYEVKRNLTWTKSNPWPRNVQSSPVQRTETGLWAVKRVKKSTKWVHNLRPHLSYEDLVFRYPIPSKKADRPRHQTKKPDDMFREIIQIFSNPGDLILDPFSGGGTTAFAAEAEGRRHISFELSSQWHEESVRHWAEGKNAKPLKFAVTPTEKAKEAHKKFIALCKKLKVDPNTLEVMESTVEESDTHQPPAPAGDVAETDTLVPAPVQDYKHTVRLKGP
jgi:DNA modification methylase